MTEVNVYIKQMSYPSNKILQHANVLAKGNKQP